VFGGVGLDWTLVGSGDFSGYGRDDLLWRHSQIRLLVTWGNGTPQGAGSIGGVPLEWAIAGVGDFKFHGRDEVVWRGATGAVAVWRLDGASYQSAGFIGTAPSAWTIADIGD
jgi:hypothetical protein